jgi:hypothetical protein
MVLDKFRLDDKVALVTVEADVVVALQK